MFSLDNSAVNSAGVAGYYSPDSSNARVGWTLGVPVRISYAYYGTTYYKWLGQITDIMPDLSRQHKVVRINAMDYADELARLTLNGIEVATSQRADQAFATILANFPRTPDRYLAGEAQDVYPWLFDTVRDENVTAMGEFNKLALSEFGFVYVRGDVDGGGTLVYEPRGLRDPVSRWAMTDTDINDMSISYSLDDIINRVLVTIHPREEQTDPTVLFVLGNRPAIDAGETLAFNCPYRESTGSLARIGGYNMITPTTSEPDYRGNTTVGGTGGVTLTSGFSVTADFGGNSADVTVTNGTTQDGYLRLLQLRGYALPSVESIVCRAESTAGIDAFGPQTENIDMPYQDSAYAGTQAAEQILAKNKDPRTRCRSVSFLPNKSSSLMIQALAREVGDRITVTESVSGLDTDYVIQSVEFDVKPNSWSEVTWRLAPAEAENWSSTDTWPSK